MSVRQINTSDYDYSMFLETLNKAYKGKNEITLSEYDTDAAPVVKIGSVFENNGAIFIIESADMTPLDYGSMTVSTIFYLYFKASDFTFYYSNTAPTWNDALQGWYTNNDRALFKMFKDGAGTLYQDKQLLMPQNNFFMPNRMAVSKGSFPTYFSTAAASSSGSLYTAIAGFFVNTNIVEATINGTIFLSAQPHLVYHIGGAQRTSGTNIRIFTVEYNNTTNTWTTNNFDISSGGALSMGWAINIS